MVPAGDRALTFLEIKASRTVTPAMAEPLVRLGKVVRRYDVTSLVVHRRAADEGAFAAVRPGVKAVTADQLLAVLARPTRRRGRRAG